MLTNLFYMFETHKLSQKRFCNEGGPYWILKIKNVSKAR